MASAKKFFKRLGRKTAKVHKVINRVATPVVAAGASFFGGPAAGAAVTAIGAQAGYYFRATEARDKGIQGRAARSLGRGERKRVAIYGAAGTGAGTLGSFGTSLLGGQSLGTSALHGLLGQGGAQILGVDGTVLATPTQQALAAGVGPFGAINPAVSGTQLAGPGVPGLVTQSQLVSQLAGGATATEAAAASSSGGTLGKILTASTTLLNAYGKTQGIASTSAGGSRGHGDTVNPNDYQPLFGGGGGEAGGGGGGGLNSPLPGMGEEQSSKGGLAAAILIGALLLAG